MSVSEALRHRARVYREWAETGDAADKDFRRRLADYFDREAEKLERAAEPLERSP